MPGAGLARPLFQSLGVDAQILGEAPDGRFEHPPEPTAENLKSVASRAVHSVPMSSFAKIPMPTGWPSSMNAVNTSVKNTRWRLPCAIDFKRSAETS